MEMAMMDKFMKPMYYRVNENSIRFSLQVMNHGYSNKTLCLGLLGWKI